MKTTLTKLSLIGLSLLALLSAPLIFNQSQPAQAADHRDAPGISEDGRADILDVYAFVNPNNGNVVLALTVNPFVIGGAIQVAFSPDVLYEFQIDNTGDYKEDLVVQARFTPTVPGPQMVAVSEPCAHKGPKKCQKCTAVTGPANGTVINGTQGISVFAGLRDDPFFIDLIWVLRLIGAQPGGPLTRAPGLDFFKALNCSILVVEVPASALRGSTGDIIHVWGTTSRAKLTMRSDKVNKEDKDHGAFVQVDREGLPVINTVLIPPPLKDAFNRGVPATDRKLFRDAAIASLMGINGDAAYSAVIADLLLPDVLTLDVSKTDGFLNGRRPQDDVIDAVLNAASHGAVTTDNVSANDVPFLSAFPFFAPPHAASEPIPGRN